MLEYHGRAGDRAALALTVGRMAVDGLDRGHLLAMARNTLDGLPVLQ